MSHFTVAVFTENNGKSVRSNIENLLAPFDEAIEYEPYIKYTKEEAIAKEREDIQHYANTTYAEFLKDPVAYKEKWGHNQDHINYLENEFPKRLNWTDEECYNKSKEWYNDDMIDEEGNLLSTYNPNSKWDWYEIGGRWNKCLTTKNGDNVNSALVKDIDFPEDFSTFAVLLPDGTWHENGTMGWWAIVIDEKEDWYDTYKEKFIDTANPEWTLTIVDCHI